MTNLVRPSRRLLLATGLGLLLADGSRARPAAGGVYPPMRCADFLESIGVNTHIGYADSQYNDAATILTALRYLGVKHVRDNAVNESAQKAADRYRALAAAGVSFCLFWGPKRDMGEVIGQMAKLEAAHPGAIQALEGPNEIKPAFAYAGTTGNAAARAFMRDMRAAAGANPHLRDKPLVSFTSYAPVETDCDFANDHPYPKAGRQPESTVRSARDRYVGAGGVMPGKAMVFTEFGYHTLVGQPVKPNFWQGVDPRTHAILLVNGLLDCAALNITRTYIYQLLDAHPDAGPMPNQENHFGLFALDGSPKPAATALKMLFARLGDKGSHAHDFALAPSPAQVDAATPMSCLPLQDSGNRHFFVFWNESPIWSKEAAAAVAIEPGVATLSLKRAAPIKTFGVFEAAPSRDFGVTQRIVVNVGAEPVIVQVG